MDKKLIVRRIDELLEEKHKTRYALQEHEGISSTIYQWRKNTAREATRTPSLRSIERVCDFLGVSLSYFFAFTNDENQKYRVQDLENKLTALNEEQLYAVTDAAIQFFDDYANAGERFKFTLDRVGWDKFREVIQEAYHGKN